MTARIGNPMPFFIDKRGLPMDGGRLYIGATGEDPEVTPVTVYLDEALTVEATQPIRIIGGFATHDGNPAFFFIAADGYSIRVRDRDYGEVHYYPDAVTDFTSWQPLNSSLTAIAALSTTTYGRGILTAADAAAARLYLGMVAYLPLTGGTVTGNIIREMAGSHLYHNDPDLVSGRVFVTANGASDPTSLLGDIWLELEA